MRQKAAVELFAGGFVIDGHTKGGSVRRLAKKRHAINTAMQSEHVTVAEGELPRRIASFAEGKLNRDGIEFVLVAHPTDECLDEVLERAGQNLAGKAARLGGLQKAMAIAGDERLGNSSDSGAGFLRRHITPATLLRPQS